MPHESKIGTGNNIGATLWEKQTKRRQAERRQCGTLASCMPLILHKKCAVPILCSIAIRHHSALSPSTVPHT